MMLNYNIWARLFFISWISLVEALKFRETTLLCPPPPADCTLDGGSRLQMESMDQLWIQYFIVNGESVEYEITDEDPSELSINCDFLTTLSIQDASLPKFDFATRFKSILVKDCASPYISYVSALDALNVIGYTQLTFTNLNVNEESPFPPHHFLGLDNVQSLKIIFNRHTSRYLDLNFLKYVENLKRLELHGVIIPPFPLWNQVRDIRVSDCVPLEKLQPWGGCSHLESLEIMDFQTNILFIMTGLPEKWLANCTRLSSLIIKRAIANRPIFPKNPPNTQNVHINLPQHMVNSSLLRQLSVVNCQMKNISNNVFENAKNLRILDISHNKLTYLSRDTFSSITNLEKLILTNNKLKVQSLASFAPLVHLRDLVLDGNFKKDTCEVSDKNNVTNSWPLLPSLERLSLKSTGVTKLCPEWNQSMPKLKYLDLTWNSVEKLQYKDVKMIRNGWKVDLRKNELEIILYEENDYNAHWVDTGLVNNTSSSSATIRIDHFPRDCNCHWYWFARTLRERPLDVLIPDLVCDQKLGKTTDAMPIVHKSLESFVCEIECGRGCKCTRRTHDGTVVVECNGANLTQVPHFSLPREIHVANNYIETLNISDFSDTLEYMDLRYNRLSMVDAEIASALFGRSNVSFRFEGNPIICACNNSEFINALKTHQNQVLDYENVTCKYGQLMKYVTDSLCEEEQSMLAIVIVLGCVALVPFIFSIFYYRYKNEISIILYAWGWCACCVNEEELDKNKAYDVFVSFAHDDSTFVMEELLPGLEKEPRAFTVCIHYRDWMPGEWIPTQIAESVEQSRRTIIVLSKNFLSSIWSLLEFRTAHTQALKDNRVRLIIVLLDDVVGDERLDGELRAYLSTNTYIRRGDPRFWDKLQYALPHRRRDEERARAAGEAVVRRVRPDDPPAVLRADAALELLAIGPAHDTDQQEVSIS